jgi:hypothetical protein
VKGFWQIINEKWLSTWGLTAAAGDDDQLASANENNWANSD